MKLDHESIINHLGFHYNRRLKEYRDGNFTIKNNLRTKKISHRPHYRKYLIYCRGSWACVGTTEDVFLFQKSLLFGPDQVIHYFRRIGPYSIDVMNGNCSVYCRGAIVLDIAQRQPLSIGQLVYINQLVDPAINLLDDLKQKNTISIWVDKN